MLKPRFTPFPFTGTVGGFQTKYEVDILHDNQSMDVTPKVAVTNIFSEN